MYSGYWGKCGENEPQRVIDELVKQESPRNVLFVATSTIIDFENIITKISNFTKITFSEKNGYPIDLIEKFKNKTVNFETIDVLSTAGINEKYSLVIAFGLFPKQVLWGKKVLAIQNLIELLKPNGILVASIKFDYMDEFEKTIKNLNLVKTKWTSEYEFINIRRRFNLGINGRGDIRVTYYLKSPS